MGDRDQAWTTASIEAIPRLSDTTDPTPGLVLIYSRLHEQLPASVPFAESPTTIGREADNTLSIPEAAVSRYHARVTERDGQWWLHDNGSTNGTLVNGERIEACALEDHDIVRIGDTLFRFAARGVFRYSAYRLDGSVVAQARPFKHPRGHCELEGGYQVDAIIDRVAKLAPTGLSIVVCGESGTGKELVARELHRRSGRGGPFLAINCAALPANLIESELFGHKKGAFTGASKDKVGLVRAADGGTLFLDEIGDMPKEAQAKLLRVLQEREVLPIGATVPESVDVRVVSATHRDLEELIGAGLFRGDLLARLREARIDIPPLRERREDLYPLVRHFLESAGRGDAKLSFSYMLGLAHYGWPFNVRELESAVKLSIALSKDPVLDLIHLPDVIQRALDDHGRPQGGTQPAVMPAASTGRPEPLPATAPAAEESRPLHPGTPSEEALRELLQEHGGNIAAVGRALGKERMQIHRWLKRYRIDVGDYRS